MSRGPHGDRCEVAEAPRSVWTPGIRASAHGARAAGKHEAGR